MPYRLLIADPDISFIHLVSSHLSRNSDFQIVGTSTNGEESLSLVRRLRPDIVLASALLPERDGLSLSREIRRLPSPPVIVMCTPFCSDLIADVLLKSGVSYLMFKPQTPERIEEILLTCARLYRPAESNDDSPDDVRQALSALGIHAHFSGFRFLVEAALLCVEEPGRLRNLTGWLYRDIARNLSVTPGRVERSIRLAIAQAYSSGTLGKHFPARPGNGEFLRRLMGICSESAESHG